MRKLFLFVIAAIFLSWIVCKCVPASGIYDQLGPDTLTVFDNGNIKEGMKQDSMNPVKSVIK